VRVRALGSTGLEVSELGFGCGSVGGLLVRGEYPTMRRVVGRAIELGINYFDTAAMYGNGQSEVNLGAVLARAARRRPGGDQAAPGSRRPGTRRGAVAASVEGSLRRLGRERIDLIQLHNPLDAPGPTDWTRMAPDDLAAVTGAFQFLQRQGKVRFWGITALGQTDALHRAVGAGGFHSIQAVYNLLKPSGGTPVPPGFPFQDYRQLIRRAADTRMGVIAISRSGGRGP